VQDRSPLNAVRRAAGDLQASSSSALNAEISPSALTGLAGSTSSALAVGHQIPVETEVIVEEPAQFASDNALLGRATVVEAPETVALSPSQAEFPPAAPPAGYVAAIGIGSTPATLASVGSLETEARGILTDSARQPPEGYLQASVHANPQAPPFSANPQTPPYGFTHNPADASRTFEHSEEREHEALRILRQVESEVRTLKRWYTEAIEAMRSPNPFPPTEGM